MIFQVMLLMRSDVERGSMGILDRNFLLCFLYSVGFLELVIQFMT